MNNLSITQTKTFPLALSGYLTPWANLHDKSNFKKTVV